MKKLLAIMTVLSFLSACKKTKKPEKKDTQVAVELAQKRDVPFVWEGANVYFLLTDRFNIGNPQKGVQFDQTKETAVLRGFEGGDIQGITQKIEEGYFTDLGINAIWFT
ncbi:MAG: alpha-amylase, partial [Allomuricauda sp.]